MRIVAVKEETIRIGAPMRTASISFDAMTASALAIHTDLKKSGRPVVGLAFDSIGRYGHGALLRERFIPRLLAADPESYADGGGGIDPDRAWNVVMTNEKSGGHGDRCGAVGLIDAALWDLAAKIADVPLWHLLSRNAGAAAADAKVSVYASGGHYRETNDAAGVCDDVRRAIGQGHRRFKIKIGGAALEDDLRRVEAVLAVLEPGMSLAVDGNGGFDRPTAIEYLGKLAPYALGSRSRSIRSISRCSTISRRFRRCRLRPARTCFPATMREICCATAGCARIATSCSSTFRSATALLNISASSPNSIGTVGSAIAARRMPVISWR
jgi:D(-)-tartrate dehydratase